MRKIGLTIVAIFIFKLGFSCSCVIRNNLIWDFVFETDIVFTGTVMKIDTVDYKKIIHLKVDKKYKNIVSDETQVITNMGGPDCGIYDINQGEKWLIFGYIRNNKIFTNRCTNSCNSSQDVYLTRKNEIENLIISWNKEIEIKKEGFTAKGLLNENGLIGKWTISSENGKTITNQYYSQDAKLDSSKTMRNNHITNKKYVLNDTIVNIEFSLSGYLYKRTIEFDSINSSEMIKVSKSYNYYENGELKEVSNFYSHYDLKFLDIKYNTYDYRRYFNSGVLKEFVQRDFEGNRVRKLYNRKGELRREWN